MNLIKKNSNKYICFTLNNEQFAIPLLQVKEVIGDIKITPVPEKPPYFKGIINLRGQILNIIDLKEKLKLKSSRSDKQYTIIVLDLDSSKIGILVDSVDRVSTYEVEDLNDATEVNSIIASDAVVNVAKTEKDLVLILNLSTIFDVIPYAA